jgi:putative RecB family exonuclease
MIGRMSGQTPLLPGMPERLITCTPSRLSAYEDCPRRYRYAYVDRPPPPKGPPWAHNSLGASVHTALRNWYDLAPPARVPEALPTLLKATWVREGYRDVDQERQVWRRALGWLEGCVASLPERPLGVERVLAARTPVIAFSGRADRVDSRPPELAIVDYKTGRVEPGTADAAGSRALALYAFAAARVFRRPCHRVELHHLPTGTVASADLTDETIARQVERAERAATDIREAERAVTGGADADETFPTTPGPMCGWCDYRRACPDGRQRPGHESWAAIDRPAVAAADAEM